MSKAELRKQFYQNNLHFIESMDSISKAYRQGIWTLTMLKRKGIKKVIIRGGLLCLVMGMVLIIAIYQLL